MKISPESLPSILVVDDDPMTARSLMRLLTRHGYQATCARSAREARILLQTHRHDLMLLDIRMPGESGMELAEELGSTHPDIATIMVTGLDDPDVAEKALETGAYGYVIKPFKSNELLINVSNALRRRGLESENRRQREELREEVRDRTRHLSSAIGELKTAQGDLSRAAGDTLNRLAQAAEYRDGATGQHVLRMGRYCQLLARELPLPSWQSALIDQASLLHDVGKIAIPDRLLLKPGPLTLDEFDVMKSHTVIGAKILAGSEAPLLQMASRIALTHHERYDGTGYPHGLKGDRIPTEGRIAAVADVFDALTTDRVYRRAFEMPRAIDMMRGGSGSQFDPEILDTFLDRLDLVLAVREQHLSTDSQPM